MRMKWLFVFLILCCAAFARPARACESCYKAGETTPIGNKLEKATCWTEDKGWWQSCSVNSNYTDCDLSSTDMMACPIPTDYSGGGGGGGSYGSGGSYCTTRMGGSCPIDCWDCGSDSWWYLY